MEENKEEEEKKIEEEIKKEIEKRKKILDEEFDKYKIVFGI